MFFLFPFAAGLAAAPASQRAPQHWALPLLQEPQSARAQSQLENGFADAVSRAGNTATDLLKRALGSMTSSMTALGNGANALFSQIVAALAYERMARETATFLGMFWPGFVQPKPQLGFAGPWIAPAAGLPSFAWFGLPGGQPASGLPNPWSAVTEAIDMWTSLWAPAATPQRRASSSGANGPVTTTFGIPGFCWNVTLG